MSKYKFKDEMTISDKVGPRGVVALYQDGKILFRKENMITDIGRTYVFYHFLKSFMEEEDITNNDFSILNGLRLASFALGSGGSMTTPDTNKLDSIITEFGEGEEKDGFIPIGSELAHTGKELVITHTISDIKKSHTIQELGLFLNKDQLFSRVTFDPIPINPGSNYELEYTIYF